jgi:hypothetical protein
MRMQVREEGKVFLLLLLLQVHSQANNNIRDESEHAVTI